MLEQSKTVVGLLLQRVLLRTRWKGGRRPRRRRIVEGIVFFDILSFFTPPAARPERLPWRRLR